MSFLTLDFESYYGDKYSLTALTYEQYIRDERFKIHGVGIKVDNNPPVYYRDRDVEAVLREEFFTPGNDHTMICHNTLFDGTVLSWYYGLRAQTYYCTQAMSRALWNQSSSSLEALCRRLWPDDPIMRKGKELVSFKNRRDLTDEEQRNMALYCIGDPETGRMGDVPLTYEAFATMWRMFPDEELDILDMTLQMAIHPGFVLDRYIVKKHLEQVQNEKKAAIEQSGTTKTVLASGPKFVQFIKEEFGLDVPIIPSPTPKNPDNVKPALSKDELVCKRFIADHPEVENAFKGRFSVASTQEESRAKRLLEHSLALPGKPDGVISLPLNYAKAHTLRWGGANKINPQNFGRNSPLRRAITAPKGFLVGVGDLSNIEARKLAWWADETQLLTMYRNGVDVYSDFATDIYNRPINRKAKAIDEDGNEYYPDFIEGFVGKVAVLGLGYQMGPPKFKDTLEAGALGGPPVYMTLDQCKHIVYDVFRGRNRRIVTAWDECDQILQDMMMMKPGDAYKWRHLIVEHGRLRLPNGMYLNYPGLRWIENDDTNGRPEIQYWNGQYFTKIYPGKLTENIIQALARITIAEQMLAINKWLISFGLGERVLLTVHDEIVCLFKAEYAEERMQEMLDKMRVPPHWCADIPLDAEGGYDVCYSK